MQLELVPLSNSHVRGIYRVGGEDGRMPERMRLLHPEAARDYAGIATHAVVSDMFRSPESSLKAVQDGRGAQPPSFSAHNYGLAIDLDISATMRSLGVKRKTELDAWMESHGFFCHRRDGLMKFEAWHYNHLGVGARPSGTRTSDEIEERILSLYGRYLAPDDRRCQQLLKDLGMYRGGIDGKIGPLSRAAISAFQKKWGVKEKDGVLGPRTRRTLAYVTAEKKLIVEAR